MATVSAILYYAAPLSPMGREDNWTIDAVSRPPEWIFNFKKVAVETTITDLRGSPIQPKLDVMGFERLSVPTNVDQRELSIGLASSLNDYQIETAEVLRAFTSADRVVFFDATIRMEDTESARSEQQHSAHLRVHVDQNPTSARARATKHGGELNKCSRFQIVNVWRPLIQPIRNYPLALCDYGSLDIAADLVPTRLHFPPWLQDRENYSLKENARHRWYYWSALSIDEVVVFKCYDSASRELNLAGKGTQMLPLRDVSGLCPHSAFFDKAGPSNGHLRTSLEMRALLFYS